MRKQYWQAWTSKSQNKILDEVENVVSRRGGFILNFNMFSDLDKEWLAFLNISFSKGTGDKLREIPVVPG